MTMSTMSTMSFGEKIFVPPQAPYEKYAETRTSAVNLTTSRYLRPRSPTNCSSHCFPQARPHSGFLFLFLFLFFLYEKKQLFGRKEKSCLLDDKFSVKLESPVNLTTSMYLRPRSTSRLLFALLSASTAGSCSSFYSSLFPPQKKNERACVAPYLLWLGDNVSPLLRAHASSSFMLPPLAKQPMQICSIFDICTELYFSVS